MRVRLHPHNATRVSRRSIDPFAPRTSMSPL
jgi:hypothetical protein